MLQTSVLCEDPNYVHGNKSVTHKNNKNNKRRRGFIIILRQEIRLVVHWSSSFSSISLSLVIYMHCMSSFYFILIWSLLSFCFYNHMNRYLHTPCLIDFMLIPPESWRLKIFLSLRLGFPPSVFLRWILGEIIIFSNWKGLIIFVDIGFFIILDFKWVSLCDPNSNVTTEVNEGMLCTPSKLLIVLTMMVTSPKWLPN